MALIDEAKAEVIQRYTGAVQPMAEAPVGELKKTSKTRRRNPEDMTKEEREAWLQKKREEEEARYLKDRAENKGAKVAQPEAKVKRVRKAKAESASNPAPKPAPKPTSKPVPKSVPKPVQRCRKAEPQRPRIAQPLEPLYLLRIPGLPKGDCIAICYARGADVSCS